MLVKHFGLETGQDPEILGIAFETAILVGDLIECAFAVVPVGRVPDVMGQPGQLDEVEVAAHSDRHAAPDLRDLQRVGQPGARGVTFTRSDDLCLVGQAAQRGTVQHACPIPGEVGAVLTFGARQTRGLRRFAHPPLTVEVVVWVLQVRDHRRTVCQGMPGSGLALPHGVPRLGVARRTPCGPALSRGLN